MTLIYILDLIGTFVFAISGTLAASNKKLDLFGGLFTGVITAVGGGTIRDLLIGATPVGWISDLNYLFVITAGVVVTFFLKDYIMRWRKTLFLFDTIGIGVFTLIGLEKALAFQINPLVAVMMGVITAVMGGLLRDTFINDIPLVLRKEIYATACLAGAGLYFLLGLTGLNHQVVMILTVSLIIGIRLLSVKYQLSLPIIHERININRSAKK